MPYVHFNQSGDVIAARVDAADGWSFVNFHDPRLYAYVKASGDRGFHDDLLAALAASDRDMARLVEDLIDLLVRLAVIRREDIPRQAEAKLAHRRGLRLLLKALSDHPSPSDPLRPGHAPDQRAGNT